MKLSLVVLAAGKSQGQAIPITLSHFIIGRDPQCNLRPASAVISKRHCAILVREGKVFLKDFDSTNGTFVNDIQVKGEVPIKNDDILTIGPLSFKVVIETKAPGSKPTPPPSKPVAASPARSGGADEESVAAMLLSLGEEGASLGDESTSASDSNVPGGSTVMDVVPLPPPEGNDNKPDANNKPAAPTKKPDPKAGDPAHLAAKAILEKYTRRQRG